VKLFYSEHHRYEPLETVDPDESKLVTGRTALPIYGSMASFALAIPF